tara:strand:- start:169 stop:687 length:519 start_codon:yes stop_codon:yes gene_type:complete
MNFFKITIFTLISLGTLTPIDIAFSEGLNPQNYKVLSINNDKFSIINVKNFIAKGDDFIKKGNYEKAKDSYDKARNLARQLSGFYRDLSGSFRGIDARIPREMDTKGRESLRIWADSNSRLSKLYKLKKQPEVAVPLLVEIIKIMSPSSPEGKSAYNELMELGFVVTPYKGI